MKRAKIRTIKLGKRYHYLVEWGSGNRFQLFNYIDSARLFCIIDLDMPYEETR